MNGNDEPEWLLPIDPMVDSYAPEQIELELGQRLALYLREAQRLVHDGAAPDADGLEAGIHAETQRYLTVQPWLADPRLRPAVSAVEDAVLTAVRAIAAAARPAPPAPRPVRRLTLQPSATIVGNMSVRKRSEGHDIELAWDAAPNVSEWTIRVSDRPDPRQDYVEGELVTLPAATRTFTVALDEHPRRIQLYGLARDGRIVRRAVISALTLGNSGAQWKRQATAS